MSVPAPIARLTAIPVHIDPDVPAGQRVFDCDPQEPRHIIRIRVHDREDIRGISLTDAQTEQVRDHYRAMDERAGQLLADWVRLMATVSRT